eukprot:6469411-Amphidinium_carterae.1
MRRGGAKVSLLRWVRRSYVCASCQASTRPPAHNPATAGTTYSFNHIIAVDLFHMECPFRPEGNRDVQLLSCLCWGTNYLVIAEVTTKTAEATYEAFARCWLQYFSFPKILVSDQGGEFDGVFHQALSQGGTLQHTTDSQSPWQNGRCERAHEHVRRIFELTEQEIVPTSESEWLACLHSCVGIRNRRLNHAGYSPIQRVLGVTPELPEEVTDGAQADAFVDGPLSSMRRTADIRAAAAAASARIDSRDRIMRAQRAKKRPEAPALQPGQLCYVWRSGMRRAQRGWYRPAVVLNITRSGCYVAMRGSLWKISHENVRAAVQEESDANRMMERYLHQYRREIPKLTAKGFVDCTGERHVPEQGAEAASHEPAVSNELNEDRAIAADGDQAVVDELPTPPIEETMWREPDDGDTVHRGTTRGAEADSPDAPEQRRQRTQSFPYPTPPGRQLWEETEKTGSQGHEDDAVVKSGEVKIEWLPLEVQKRFTQGSRVKEAEAVLASIGVLSPEEAREVETNHKERIIGSRWLDVWKIFKKHDNDYDNGIPAEVARKMGIPKHVDAKSRLVLKGYTDPDSGLLQTATPTPENVDINMVLSCRLSMLASLRWSATVGDIKAAFNQSMLGLREKAIYISSYRKEGFHPNTRMLAMQSSPESFTACKVVQWLGD